MRATTEQNTDQAVETLRALTRAGKRPMRLSIGVVNNMPDSALKAAERQFVSFLKQAADHFDIRVQLFSLPGVARGGEARDHVETSYIDFTRLQDMHMDALLVTGAVPLARCLKSEPFWPQLAGLVEWARTHTLSTLWSCLSAHAAVLHLDGIERRRLPGKLSGLYDIEARQDHWMFRGIGPGLCLPHSRYNELDEAALTAAGYEIASRSDAVGADIFTKRTPSSFVFFQGHPEYDRDSLMREFRRDVGRFLDGSSEDYPSVPTRYFNEAAEHVLADFEREARANRDASLMEKFPDLRDAMSPLGAWQDNAATLFRNWVGHVVMLKLERAQRAGVAA
jgi:homoserine O-succinyltransferase